MESSAIDFAREVLPILSNKCFACHGPDTKKKDLVRLDREELAKKDLGGYHAIDPDELSESEVIFRIEDEEDPMPPKDFDKTLTKEEKKLIREWVMSGGEYARHWAFVPPRKNLEPKGNPIDSFIERKLLKIDGALSEQADRATLARRSSLTLNGLPPEPNLLEDFLQDKRPDAYDRYLDRLLAKVDYGEHIARFWLDAVRYGDTHGLHLDNRRGIYPYRDWVVRALNDNQPFDEFIRWQLAGDLFSEPTEDQLIATGYVRMNPTTGEGGAIPKEFQAKNNFDRVETTGTAFLGLSLTCARCHTHKYDPITHQEYFEFLAFFNNTAEHSMDGNKYEYGDHITVPKDPESRAKWKVLLKEEKKLLEKIRKSERFDDKTLDLANLTALMTPDLSRPSSKVVGSSKNTPKTQTPKHAIDDNVRTKYLNYDAKGSGLTIYTSGGIINGLSLTSAEDVPGRDPSAYKLEGSVDGKQFALISQGDVPHFKKRNQKHEIFFDNNQSYKTYRIIFPKLADLYAKEMQISEIELLKADTVSNDPLLQEAKKLHIEMTEGRKNFLTTTLVARELPEQRRRVTQILNRGEYDQPIGDPLTPGVFSVLGSMPQNSPANRMGLVDWLTNEKNPLTARVLVNRFWIMVFGEGLVRTPEEFGLQGEHPTHPELLDWLAVDFQENGWDLKRLLRQMLKSKTFQQSSKHRVELNDPENKLWGRGPSYRLDAEILRDIALWSGGLLNRKLGGEGVKPYQPSGMWKALSHPGSNTKNYIPDQDDRIYRRSLYIYWKRTSPHPMMTLFDAPSRETSCVQRSRTNTSLQSLAFFNETQRVEAARKLAERLLRKKKDDQHRIDFLFQMLASRKPTRIERDALVTLLDSARNRFSNTPESADSLLSIGLAKLDSTLDAKEVAAWTQVSSTVLASDPVILLY
ncbi:MAG: PSD1 and planctomycete cytochrome C domain-containing protein [Verrucomicrobiota bacterium]|nr:PSD1 and planctomycete cytochrome C domain-containing protein [Verrucomicrobiota bacterium]